MAEEEPLYVGITEPVDIRKDLLNSSRTILSSLKRYEDIVSIKKEKEKIIREIKKNLKEIAVLDKKLKQHMPKPFPAAASAPKPEAPQSTMIGEKTRLAELEDELARVEEKLMGME